MISRLDLLNPIKYVIDHSQHVHINLTKIDLFVQTFKPISLKHWKDACPFTYHDLSLENEIDFRFLVDSQAFCFWGYPHKWTVEYQGKQIDGWWAMLACFKRAYESSVPILDGAYLFQLNLSQAKQLFYGKPEIPLLKKRIEILTGIGHALVENNQGRFHYFLNQKNISALSLLDQITQTFPGFRDIHQYQNKQIIFHKKAQLLVSDLAHIKGIENKITITNLDQLTGKADYKIPALLRNHGILEYSSELAKIVDNRITIPAGSVIEVEIRASMIWATELISQGLKKQGILSSPIELDNILWVMSQEKSPQDKPYHLTLTTDY